MCCKPAHTWYLQRAMHMHAAGLLLCPYMLSQAGSLLVALRGRIGFAVPTKLAGVSSLCKPSRARAHTRVTIHKVYVSMHSQVIALTCALPRACTSHSCMCTRTPRMGSMTATFVCVPSDGWLCESRPAVGRASRCRSGCTGTTVSPSAGPGTPSCVSTRPGRSRHFRGRCGF